MSAATPKPDARPMRVADAPFQDGLTPDQILALESVKLKSVPLRKKTLQRLKDAGYKRLAHVATAPAGAIHAIHKIQADELDLLSTAIRSRLATPRTPTPFEPTTGIRGPAKTEAGRVSASLSLPIPERARVQTLCGHFPLTWLIFGAAESSRAAHGAARGIQLAALFGMDRAAIAARFSLDDAQTEMLFAAAKSTMTRIEAAVARGAITPTERIALRDRIRAWPSSEVSNLLRHRAHWNRFERWCRIVDLPAYPTEPFIIGHFLGTIDPRSETLRTSTILGIVTITAALGQRIDKDHPAILRSADARVSGAAAARTAGTTRLGTLTALKTPTLATPKPKIAEPIPGGVVTNRRDRAIVELNHATGLSAAHLVALEVDDLVFNADGLYVCAGRVGRTREVLQIPRDTAAHRAIASCRAWLEISGITTGHLFRSISNDRVNPGGIQTASLHRMMQIKAGRPGIRQLTRQIHPDVRLHRMTGAVWKALPRDAIAAAPAADATDAYAWYRRRLIELGISQRDVCAAAEINESLMRPKMYGRRPCTALELIRLARALEVPEPELRRRIANAA